MKAFAVTSLKTHGPTCISLYGAKNASEAKADAHNVLRELGYKSKDIWGGLRAKRAPEFDVVADHLHGQAPETAEHYLKAKQEAQ